MQIKKNMCHHYSSIYREGGLLICPLLVTVLLSDLFTNAFSATPGAPLSASTSPWFCNKHPESGYCSEPTPQCFNDISKWTGLDTESGLTGRDMASGLTEWETGSGLKQLLNPASTAPLWWLSCWLLQALMKNCKTDDKHYWSCWDGNHACLFFSFTIQFQCDALPDLHTKRISWHLPPWDRNSHTWPSNNTCIGDYIHTNQNIYTSKPKYLHD